MNAFKGPFIPKRHINYFVYFKSKNYFLSIRVGYNYDFILFKEE
jgi:hypothetical protein